MTKTDSIPELNLRRDPERLGLLLNALDNQHSHYARLDSDARELIRAQVIEYAQEHGIKPKRFRRRKPKPAAGSPPAVPSSGELLEKPLEPEQTQSSPPVDAPRLAPKPVAAPGGLLEKLDELGRERAQSLPLFADPGRLARKPRCSRTKDFSVIRSAQHALTHEYIQPNSPVAYCRLVFDLDWHDKKHPNHALSLRHLAEHNAWEKELSVPAPEWLALARDKNSGHVGYEITTPVGRHENARIKPQRFLAAIESALGEALGADVGYAGLLCKNPINGQWDLYRCHEGGRELSELADWLDLPRKTALKYNRVPRGEVGRNVYLFDMIRFWSYENIGKYRAGSSYDVWCEAVLIQAQIINAASYGHLTTLSKHDPMELSECKSIAKSIAKWTWKNHGTPTLTKAFSALQAFRGKRGAVAAATAKRQTREEQIIAAIGQLTARGVPPSLRSVAELVGCSFSTLSKHYKHLFPSA